MPVACKYCIATHDLKGGEISFLPQTEDELFDHIEREHHIPVQREGETKKQASKRFMRENPEAGGPNCKCPSCQGKQHVLDLIESLRDAGLPSRLCSNPARKCLDARHDFDGRKSNGATN